jgi:septal ring factor EnvC (AmiA/AmiB activator)
VKLVEFLRTEFRVGLTAIKIAQTAKDEAKRNRNRRNAQAAYEAILRFLPKLTLTSREVDEVQSDLATLKAELQKLSERRAEEGHGR